MLILRKVLLTCLLAASVVAPVVAAELATQKSSERGVTVIVTPQNLSGNSKTWDFKIVLDTHSGDLNDDLLQTTILLVDSGAKQAPIGWEGAGPGGHHREGLLRFKAIEPLRSSIELNIQRAGETAPRSFRWQIN